MFVVLVAAYRVSRSDGTAMSLQAQAPSQRSARYSPQETVKVSFYEAFFISNYRDVKGKINNTTHYI